MASASASVSVSVRLGRAGGQGISRQVSWVVRGPLEALALVPSLALVLAVRVAVTVSQGLVRWILFGSLAPTASSKGDAVDPGASSSMPYVRLLRFRANGMVDDGQRAPAHFPAALVVACARLAGVVARCLALAAALVAAWWLAPAVVPSLRKLPIRTLGFTL